MSRSRVMAIVWRHVYNFRHSADKLFDMFYWPVMDLILWGLTSKYILEMTNDAPDVMKVLLSGLVFWQVVWRSQYEVTINLLEEMWSYNMVNLFSTPLTLIEWIGGIMMIALIKLAFCGDITYEWLVDWLFCIRLVGEIWKKNSDISLEWSVYVGSF